MIRSVYRDAAGQIENDIPPDQYMTRLAVDEALLWVDIHDEPLEGAESILREVFQFHPLAVDDALRELHIAKIDDWGSYLYVGLDVIVPGVEALEDIVTADLDLFVGRNYIVSYQTEGLAAVQRVWEMMEHDERLLSQGVGRVLYLLADEVVSGYFPAVDEIDDRLDQIEDQLLQGSGTLNTESILQLKHALSDLRRIVTPMREVMGRLSRNGSEVLAPETGVFFADVYDHLVRLYDIIENLRDLLTSSLDMQLSMTGHRTNEIIRVLTIMSTLFMPLTFIVGFFGMNHFAPVADLSGWTGKASLALVIVVVVALPFGMYMWMRKRAWM